MLTVKDILSRKGRKTINIRPDKTVYEALGVMAANGIGALLVVEDGELKGIFSERDYARKVVLAGKQEDTTTVGEVMVTLLSSVTPGDTVEACMKLMTERRIRHLPVYENGVLVGIVTIGDVVKDVIEQHKTTINNLEQYISGGYLPAHHQIDVHRAASEAPRAAAG